MLDNLGLNGGDLVDEVFEKNSPYVEEFAEREPEAFAGAKWKAKPCVWLLPGEFAVAAPGSMSILGASLLEVSLAVYLHEPQSRRTALINAPFMDDANDASMRKEIDQVIREIAVELLDGTSAGQGSNGIKSTRRASPLLEAYMIGGVQLEPILSMVLSSLWDSSFRFVIRLAGVGRLNEGSFHGVNELKDASLITAVAARTDTDADSFDLVPVKSFECKGPALTMRKCRMLAASKLGEYHLRRIWRDGRFTIQRFHFECPSHQSIAVLLMKSYAEPLALWQLFHGESGEGENVSGAKLDGFACDFRAVLLFMLRHQSSESLFGSGEEIVIGYHKTRGWDDAKYRIPNIPEFPQSEVHPHSLVKEYVKLSKKRKV